MAIVVSFQPSFKILRESNVGLIRVGYAPEHINVVHSGLGRLRIRLLDKAAPLRSTNYAGHASLSFYLNFCIKFGRFLNMACHA